MDFVSFFPISIFGVLIIAVFWVNIKIILGIKNTEFICDVIKDLLYLLMFFQSAILLLFFYEEAGLLIIPLTLPDNYFSYFLIKSILLQYANIIFNFSISLSFFYFLKSLPRKERRKIKMSSINHSLSEETSELTQ